VISLFVDSKASSTMELSKGSTIESLSKRRKKRLGNMNSHNRSMTESTGSGKAYVKLYSQTKSKFEQKPAKNKNSKMDHYNSMYFPNDRAGPGTYNLPALLGSFTMETNKMNYPAFTIGTSSKDRLLILWKNQAIASKGKSSPGVWTYDGDNISLKEKYPIATVGRESRFLTIKSEDTLNASVPHYYDSFDRNSIKQNGNKTNGFKKSIRFLERDRLLKYNEGTPSCQSYNNSNYMTINDNSLKMHKIPKNNHATTKSMGKFEVHSYCKELVKGYLNKDTPGPAAYSNENRNNLSNYRMSFNGSFSRDKRNLDKLTDFIITPGPHEYDTISNHASFKNIRGAGTIGKGRRQIDVKLMKSDFVKELFTKMEIRK
jgi:hypothetical protein